MHFYCVLLEGVASESPRRSEATETSASWPFWPARRGPNHPAAPRRLKQTQPAIEPICTKSPNHPAAPMRLKLLTAASMFTAWTCVRITPPLRGN